MAQRSRSFTEYVKNKLDNQLWSALEEYLGRIDFSALELLLYNIANIGEIELYDTDIQFVNAADVPGTKIAFDVVLDATLLIYDADRYHNDKSEATHQWFMLKCEGDLSCNLEDVSVNDIEVYCGRNKKNRPLSDSLVSVIYKDQLEKEATSFL